MRPGEEETPPLEQAELFAEARPSEAPETPRFMRAAEVAFNLPLAPLTYGIPGRVASEVEVGALVEGRLRGRKDIGCVVGVAEGKGAEEAQRGLKAVQPILRRVTPEFRITGELIDLARWLADYYMCSLGEALACISFIGFHDLAGGRQIVGYRLAALGAGAAETRDLEEAGARLTRRQRQVLEWFRVQAPPRQTDGHPAFSRRELHEALSVTDGVLKRMVEAGVLETCELLQESEDSFRVEEVVPDEPPELTPDQVRAVEEIGESLRSGAYATFLLQGVTGSGKTEVYLRALAEAVSQRKAGIVLVPEISLTPQTVGRFRARFGERVGVYHSRLTPNDKLRLWRRLARGELDVVVGARSAVFSPFERLGLIIVDEEHEATYKQDSVPRYHARDAAIYRAHRLGAAVILGSATPSLESAFNAESGKYRLLRLETRIQMAALPPVEIVDMGRELRDGGMDGHLSRMLRMAMRETIDRGEHVLLLLNRRGYTSFFYCPVCRKALDCPHCDVTLSHHRRGDCLTCHMCGFTQPAPRQCPQCGHDLNRIGVGTERLEEDLARLFPGRRIMRLDQDTTGGKQRWNEIWRDLEAGEIDIIFGTQMIAKGLHLERVTCVGVVLADITLAQPDFRAEERTFSLITQVAGRAGRGTLAGKVFVQTYQPHHFALQFAARHDYAGFYAQELKRRRVTSYPPFGRLVAVTVGAMEGEAARRHAEQIAGLLRLRERAAGRDVFRTFGPTPAPIQKIKDLWRWRVLLRGRNVGRMRAALRSALEESRERMPRSWGQHRVTLDVDPQDLM